MNGNSRMALLAAVAFMVLGAGMLWAGWALYAESARLLQQGLAATGTVVAVHTEESRSHDAYPDQLQSGIRGTSPRRP